MQFILDVHCHTVNSGHAYSTITENAAHAAKIGLTHIGISDHAPEMPGGAHFYHFSNLWTLPEVIHGVRVFKGVECNIKDAEGRLDLPGDLLSDMDYVIASMHRGVIPPTNCATHTRAMILAMEKNPDMHILGHPGCRFFDIDIEAVVDAAARTHTIIEINNQSLIPGSFRFHGDETFLKILEFCKEYKVPILASSDAHYASYVGNLDRAKAIIEAVGINETQVLNTCPERFLTAISKKKGEYHAISGQA